MRAQRDIYIFASFATSLVWMLVGTAVLGQEKDFNAYPEPVAEHLKRLYGQNEQCLAFREDYPGGFEKWQHDARAALRVKLGNGQDCGVGRPPSAERRIGPVGGSRSVYPPARRHRDRARRSHPVLAAQAEGRGQVAAGDLPHGHDRRATTPRPASMRMRLTKRNPLPKIVTWRCKP